MKKLLKKLGYGYCIQYNGYSEKFEVYRIGEYSVLGSRDESRISSDKNPKKAIKNYIKNYK